MLFKTCFVMLLAGAILHTGLQAQNVGIGETAPTASRLQVKSADSAVMLLHNSSTTGNNIKTGLFFKTGNAYSGSIATIGLSNTHRMGFFTYGGSAASGLLERLTILDGGNTGIGIIAPSSKLHVQSADSNLLLLQNSTTLNNNVKSALFFKTGSDNAYYTGAIKTIGTGQNASRLGFYTYASTDPNSLSERLTITDNGNIGIGNLAPAYTLDLTGNARVTATLTTSNLAVNGGTPAAGEVLTAVNSNGDATWQPLPTKNSAFQAGMTTTAFSFNAEGKIPFTCYNAEDYNTGTSEVSNTQSYFRPTQAGVYHFDLNLYLESRVLISGEYYENYVDDFVDIYPAVTVYVKVNSVVKRSFKKFYKAGEYISGSIDKSVTLKLNANDTVEFYLLRTIPVDENYPVNLTNASKITGYRIY